MPTVEPLATALALACLSRSSAEMGPVPLVKDWVWVLPFWLACADVVCVV
ncbi:MAG: hypothetical protein QM749_16225 [Aquabacterium sp.]